jgi:hypothetical protein
VNPWLSSLRKYSKVRHRLPYGRGSVRIPRGSTDIIPWEAGMVAVEPGLCRTCEHVQIVRSDRGSIFYRCKLSDTDARFPKYPRLPVIECDGWEEKNEHE